MIPETCLAPDAETVTLGALLVSPDVEAARTLRDAVGSPDAFAEGRHALLFRAISAGIDQGLLPDRLTLHHTLAAQGTGGAVTDWGTLIADLADRVSHASQGTGAVRILTERWARRRLWAESQRLALAAQDPTLPVDAVVAETQARMALVGGARGSGAPNAVGGLTYPVLDALTSPTASGADSGVSTGIPALDALLDGWCPGRLGVVAGRPGSGKSAYGLHAALTAAQEGPVLVTSLEMSETELIHRFLSALTGIPATRIRQKQCTDYEWSRIATAAGDFAKLPLFLDTTSRMPQDVRRALDLGRSQAGAPWRLVVADYLSLFAWPSKTERRDLEVGAIARYFKREVAVGCHVPVLLLAQLRRLGKAETQTVPRLDDLRESGEIEQHADQVVLLHYGGNDPVEPNSLKERWESPDLTKLLVAKNRHGACGDVRARYRRAVYQWDDWGR